jgi:hypothetical protein
MTRSEFTHILKSLGGLSPQQMQRLRRELDSKLAATSNPGPGSIGAMPDATDELDQAAHSTAPDVMRSTYDVNSGVGSGEGLGCKTRSSTSRSCCCITRASALDRIGKRADLP